MELLKAREIAVSICYKLQPFVDRINIAGSIRRQNPHVKDIEIICNPSVITKEQPDLFGGSIQHSEIHPEFKSTVLSLGKVIKGKPVGRFMQIELPEGIMLDLFMPQPTDYYRQYAIRTGSANYSQLMIATGWKRLGWVGTDDGLRRKDQCSEVKLPDGKSKWICKVENPALPPIWQSEQEFFKWIELEYVDPTKRNL